VYQGEMAGPPPDFTAEQQAKMSQAWGTWIEKQAAALVDVGAPTGDRASVGGSGRPLPITGYSVVEALDLDAAKATCEGHPFLDGAPADFSVDVFELTPMEM
jgi:hypothetical protein